MLGKDPAKAWASSVSIWLPTVGKSSTLIVAAVSSVFVVTHETIEAAAFFAQDQACPPDCDIK